MSLDKFGNGFAARLLLAYPPEPDYEYTEDVIPDEDTNEIGTTYERLLKMQPDTDPVFGDVPKTVTLSPDARKVLKDFQKEQAAEKRNSKDENVTSALVKLDSYACRFALTIEGMKGDAMICSEASMVSGIVFAKWFGNEMMRLYKSLKTKTVGRKKDTMIELVKRKGKMSSREISRSMNKSKDETQKQIEDMVTKGTLKSETVKAGNGREVVRYSAA